MVSLGEAEIEFNNLTAIIADLNGVMSDVKVSVSESTKTHNQTLVGTKTCNQTLAENKAFLYFFIETSTNTNGYVVQLAKV